MHKLTTAAVTPGTPGRDFTDTVASDTLIPIQINNNSSPQKDLRRTGCRGRQFAAGNEVPFHRDSGGARGLDAVCAGLPCAGGSCRSRNRRADGGYGQERYHRYAREIVKGKGRANVVMCAPDYYGLGAAGVGQGLYTGHE